MEFHKLFIEVILTGFEFAFEEQIPHRPRMLVEGIAPIIRLFCQSISKDEAKLIYESGIKFRGMTKLTLPRAIKDTILHDAIERGITTARRFALLEILWNERYLTRAQLIARVELRLGKNCFGIAAWEDTFYRDMRFTKQAFEAAGYRLLYSRKRLQRGYYLHEQPLLSSEIKQVLKTSAAEVDQRQIDIYGKLSFAERFYQGRSISDTARKVVAYRIRQENS